VLRLVFDTAAPRSQFESTSRAITSIVLSGRIKFTAGPDTLCLATFRLCHWHEHSLADHFVELATASFRQPGDRQLALALG
jgi:hypothetical protein